METTQGTKVDMNTTATCNFWTQINNKGGKSKSILNFTGKTSTYQEFGEEYTEFEMIDCFGETNFVSELDIIQ